MNIRMKIIWAVCCLTVFFSVGGAGAREDRTDPGWTKGQDWVVAVSYPSPMEDGTFSAAVRWQYRVVEAPDTTTEGVFVLEISRADAQGTPVAVVRLRKESLAPVSVETLTRRQGKTATHLTHFDVLRPLVTRGSMAPLDFPVFPVTEGERACYAFSQKVGGDLMRKREIFLEATSGDVPPAGSGLSDAVDWLKVTAAYDDGVPIFTQYWIKGAPWPSYGENDSMKYWLVDDEE